jgi:hypothetical protein
MFRFLAAAATEFLDAMVRRWTTLRNAARLRCKIAEDLPCGEVMKRIAALVLLLASSVAWAMPGKTERTNIGENGREARKAAKQQRKATKKAAKKQRKAMKRSQRTQRKAGKKTQRHA